MFESVPYTQSSHPARAGWDSLKAIGHEEERASEQRGLSRSGISKPRRGAGHLRGRREPPPFLWTHSVFTCFSVSDSRSSSKTNSISRLIFVSAAAMDPGGAARSNANALLKRSPMRAAPRAVI